MPLQRLFLMPMNAVPCGLCPAVALRFSARLALWMGMLFGATGIARCEPTVLPRNIVGPQAARAVESLSTPSTIKRWAAARKTVGRLSYRTLGLVINTADPYSLEVGAFYAKVRGLSPGQVLRIALPLKPSLTADEFARLGEQVRTHFGNNIQALALAWTLPYAVACNSITSALTLGYDAQLCSQTCAPSRLSPYFNAATARPYSDLHLRPSMMLAARNVDQAKALILRGIASDSTLGLRGAPPVHAHFVVTADVARNVRAASYPPAGPLKRVGIDIHVEAIHADQDLREVVLYLTGSPRVANLGQVHWVPGALADHLTSSGGQLLEGGDQMSVLQWIEAGATASYGTVSEPCNHLQKFPHPQLLLQHYVQGSTAIEAYWKSVAWPQQGVFVGEPLAAPFARR